MMAGCELDSAGVPQVIPGPSVPSPVPLPAPYVLDTREELVWTENIVSRGSFSIDSDDSGCKPSRVGRKSSSALSRRSMPDTCWTYSPGVGQLKIDVITLAS
jgi:hypothetical protein